MPYTKTGWDGACETCGETVPPVRREAIERFHLTHHCLSCANPEPLMAGDSALDDYAAFAIVQRNERRHWASSAGFFVRATADEGWL